MAYYETIANLPIDGLGKIIAVGEACPPCSIASEGRCVPCPEGADLPECKGCIEGQPAPIEVPWYERPVMGPVVIGTLTTLAATLAVAYLARERRG